MPTVVVMDGVLRMTAQGLYCPAGDFFIDPVRRVERALITHAHSDHARPGCGGYLTAAAGVGVLRERLGAQAVIEGWPWGEQRRIGDVTVSFHPAGHVLGSAQIRLEVGGDVTVVSGDYKTQEDCSCEAWEPVRARTFYTESTFGLPIYRWPEPAEVFADMREWWVANARQGINSVVLAYPLGKSQRVLAGLGADTPGPLVLGPGAATLTPHYEAAGRPIPPWLRADTADAESRRHTALLIVSPSELEDRWMRRWAPYATSFASGWMLLQRRRRQTQGSRRWVISDHVDWDGLLGAIAATGAERVGVMHGYTAEVTRYLREHGLDAWEVKEPRRNRTGAEQEEELEEDD